MGSKPMPYRTFHSQSRVEFIKKKFEGSFAGDNKAGSLKQTNATVRNEAKFKDLRNEKIVNSKTENDFEMVDVSKSEGKVFVKRSPAFRKEKLGCARSITRISDRQKSDSLIKLRGESQNENAKEKILEAEINDVDVEKDFKRSKTDSDLLKYCSNKSSYKGISTSVPHNSKKSDSLAVSHSEESKGSADVDISLQYSVVNKKQNNAHKKEAVHLSESIRRALQSPLPKGPPPKKPPRTFSHVPHHLISTNSLTSSINALSIATTTAPTTTTSTHPTAPPPPVTFKADIPKLRSKLEKLEKVIKIHESESQAGLAKKRLDKGADVAPTQAEASSAEDASGKDQSCLPISICLSQSAKNLSLRKLPRAKSEFYFDVNKADPEQFDSGRSTESPIGSASEGVLVSAASSEAVYDLPCMNKRNSFETFGKCSKYVKEAVNAKKAGDLHYMCTDVINKAPKYPDFLVNANNRKSIVEGNQTGTLNFSKSSLFSNVVEDESSSITGKAENTKGAPKLKEDWATCNESSEESELDAVSISSSDSSRVKQKGSTEEEVFSQAAAQRKIYVSRVSSRLMKQVPQWKSRNKSSYAHLFECCLVVGLTFCESKQNMPYIKSVFPPDKKPPPLIEHLCFPDASFWPPTSENHQPEEQYYSLVVTSDSGERKFGYCRRVLPEGGHVCLPLTYCIISPHRAGGFFYKVLEELESRHGSPGLENFIKQLYESEFPGPGERLKLKEILEEATCSTHPHSDLYLSSTFIRRPPDVRLEEKDLTQLFLLLQLPVFLKVFSSLLHERKVLLMSSSLRNLSSCMEALQSILLPFSWQHTYIPVLPTHLIEMCEAPTPYVMGLLKGRNVEKSLSSANLEDGILVDLDESRVVRCCGDEGSILPSRLVRDLKTALHLAMNANMLSESVRSVLISDAFIRFFVQVCGNYSRFIVGLPSGEKMFKKENFIRSVSSNTKQAFLDWFTETAMFNSFIQDRLQGDDEDMLVKLFSRRAMEYSEESIKDSAVLLKNYRVINRKVRTLGDKIKDFTAFTK